MQLYSLNILSFYYSIVLSARHSTVKYDHFARQTYSRDDLIIVGIFSCSVKTKTFLSENLHTFCKFYREIKCIFFSIHIDSRQILGCSPGSFSLFVSPGSFYSIHCYSGPNLDLQQTHSSHVSIFLNDLISGFRQFRSCSLRLIYSQVSVFVLFFCVCPKRKLASYEYKFSSVASVVHFD